MSRSTLRAGAFLLLLVAAVLVPVVVSGYAELRQASQARSYPEAAQHYRAAAQRLPWRANLYELAGHAYYHAKDYGRAEQAYQMAFQRQALSPQGWVAWGDVRYLAGERELATQTWEGALRQEHSSETLYSRLAQIYQENGDYARAAQVLQKYVAVHSQDAAAHYRLGILLAITEPDTALPELITASEQDPQLDPAVETLRSALNQASLEQKPSDRLVLTGRGLALVQEWDQARIAFEAAVKADDGNAEAWAWLGEAKHQTGAEAKADLERAFLLEPQSPVVRGLRGLDFQRTGMFRNALIEFQAAALYDPKNPAWQVSIGETYSKLGDLIRALQAYQAATQLAPEDPAYWRMLALFCAQNNVNIKTVGVPAAQKAVILQKDNAEALDLLGWLLFLDQRYEEAGRILDKALGLDPKNATVQLHLGMLALQRQDRAAAYDHFVKAREMGSTDAEAILNQYFP